jgi:hypothetical protein
MHTNIIKIEIVKWKNMAVCKCLLLLLCIAVCNPVLAQEVIFKRNVKEQIQRTFNDSSGPNGSVFVHSFLGAGVIIPANYSDSAAIKENGQSSNFLLGTRYKFKLNETFAVGFEVVYNHYKFQIKQTDSLNIFSPGKKNDSQKLKLNTLGVGPYVRINFGHRGNTLGKYLDLCADGGFVFGSALVAKNKVSAADGNGGEVVRTTVRKLDYVSKLQAYVGARFGINHFEVFGRYRASNLFKPSDNFYSAGVVPELPRFILGFTVVLPN